MANPIACPFACGFKDCSEYRVQLHIEERHTEDSPFVPDPEQPKTASSTTATLSRGSSKGSSSNGNSSGRDSPFEGTWTRCTRPGCGEYVALTDIDEHLDLHTAAALAAEDEDDEDEHPPPLPPRRRSCSPPRKVVEHKPSTRSPRTLASPRKLEKQSQHSKSASRSGTSLFSLFSGVSNHSRSTIRKMREPQNPGRLGKKELGPWAFEKRMPEDVRKYLLTAAEPHYEQRISRDGRLVRQAYVPNETVGLIPKLADLCSLDPDNVATYLCHPSVRHIRKLNCEGNFCGYWNIQMVLTYLQHVNPQGPQTIPNVIKIQDYIEQAWDNDICSYSRIETGGIRNTRKWIGTQEALAFFTRIGVKVEALSVEDGEDETEKAAVEELLDYVEAYFISGAEGARRYGTSYMTQLAPIYFQRFGHSMTIVGLERQSDGGRNLLVFDSSFATSDPMKRLLSGRSARSSVENILRAYRRSDLSLSRWDAFEMIIPETTQPARDAPR